jgi:branched-chain amino acid transport system ATP-binding protein
MTRASSRRTLIESPPMLVIEQLDTGYGKKQALFGLSLEARQGEIVALIGPNGAGKSTVLKAVCGLIPAWKGQIRFEGKVANTTTPAQSVSRGITFCPQGNRVFNELSVKENLEIGGFQLPSRDLAERIDEALALFPDLRNRLRQLAGKLSGGEQQMLALARALIPKPKLLMLDEPSLGLSPSLVSTVFESIIRINRENGVGILLVEQKVREALNVAQRVYSLKLGRVAFEGPAADLRDNKEKLRGLFL